MESLDNWIERQYRISAVNMLLCVSAQDIVKERPGLAQRIRPLAGAIVASPIPGAYDPEPDYFFHWYRDSAVVVDALRLLAEDEQRGLDTGAAIGDFVNFSLNLRRLDGRVLAAAPWRNAVAQDHVQFLRAEAELAQVHGDSVAFETRVNPDGTLDVLNWPRPQYDGPALRALSLLRWMRSPRFDARQAEPAGALLRADLDLVRTHGRDPCYDIWEEEVARHYYTLRVGAAALAGGADWHATRGDTAAAAACRTDASVMLGLLEEFWIAADGYYRSRIGASAAASPKDLDFAVILAAIHSADGRDGAGVHSVHDPRMHSTLARLEELFAAAYAINHGRAADRAPAMGRYAGDVYYSGGAYYFSTLGAAEFYFRASRGGANPRRLFDRGDAFLRTVRAFTPESGELSEQFDQRTGMQRSARHLGWSYAAFISCVAARNAAARAI